MVSEGDLACLSCSPAGDGRVFRPGILVQNSTVRQGYAFTGANYGDGLDLGVANSLMSAGSGVLNYGHG